MIRASSWNSTKLHATYNDHTSRAGLLHYTNNNSPEQLHVQNALQERTAIVSIVHLSRLLAFLCIYE
jgi:hypothetical protein